MLDNSGNLSRRRYHTEWSTSYNITTAAIDARTNIAGLDIPYKIKSKVPSLYNPTNYDVEWQDSSEPASTFLQTDGTYLSTNVR